MLIDEYALMAAEERREPAVREIKRERILRRGELRLVASGLSRLLRGGVPVPRAMELTARESGSPRLQKVLSKTKGLLEEGRSFCGALEAAGGFPAYFLEMVKAGEMSGRLDQIFAELAHHLEEEEERARKVREALTYPAFVLVFSLGAIFILFHWVIPKLLPLYENFDAELPAATRVLLALSQWTLPASAISALLILASFIFLRKRGELLSALLFRMPVTGRMIKDWLLARFSALLALLLESGIPVLTALEALRGISPLPLYQKDVLRIRELLSEGRGFSASLAGISWMRDSARALAASGEESGRLEGALKEIAGESQREMESRAGVMLKLLEPSLIVFVGSLVGFIVLSLILPILNMHELLR